MMKCQNCCEWFHARCIESPDDVNAPFVNFVMQIITQILTDNKGTIAVYNTERMLSEHSWFYSFQVGETKSSAWV